MHKSIRTILVVFLAVGLMASFAAPAAAQEVSVSNSAAATVDQDQTNVQVSEQNAEVKGDNNEVTQTNIQQSTQEQVGGSVAEATQGINVEVDLTL